MSSSRNYKTFDTARVYKRPEVYEESDARVEWLGRKNKFVESVFHGKLENCIRIFESCSEKEKELLRTKFMNCDDGHFVDARDDEEDKGYDSDSQHGTTALHFAARAGHVEVCKYLIDNGFDLHAVDKSRETPLYSACSLSRKNVFAFLLERGSKVDTRDWTGATPLHQVIGNGGDVEMCSLLIERGAPVDAAMDVCGQTPLNLAAYLNRDDICELLVEHGANIHAKDNTSNETPISTAFRRNYPNVVKVLLKSVDDETAASLIAENIDSQLCELGAGRKDGFRRLVVAKIGQKRPRNE